jgi:hypothetical protein
VKEPIELRDRALLIEKVFRQYVDAWLAFNAALERCASKGWPDRKAPIHVASRVQELMLRRLIVRLNYLNQHASAETDWGSCTTTALVHAKVQDNWTADDEAALSRSDAAYSALQNEIEMLISKADPPALEEPYRMARRDPELITAGWDFDKTVRALNERLSEHPGKVQQ